ncbi:MAG TPA: tetratricopeptide repeat protein [Proteobacteria bacterium]|nr:tetratricopeptide repeat protein [Pseudomonadota bacterium]
MLLIPVLNRAYGNLGGTYHHLGEYEKACWAYRKALELSPKSSRTYSLALYLLFGDTHL